jgi:hypothetical protein
MHQYACKAAASIVRSIFAAAKGVPLCHILYFFSVKIMFYYENENDLVVVETYELHNEIIKRSFELMVEPTPLKSVRNQRHDFLL